MGGSGRGIAAGIKIIKDKMLADFKLEAELK